MGTWGKGNFDSDTAADHLSILAARLLDETKAAMAGDPGDSRRTNTGASQYRAT